MASPDSRHDVHSCSYSKWHCWIFPTNPLGKVPQFSDQWPSRVQCIHCYKSARFAHIFAMHIFSFLLSFSSDWLVTYTLQFCLCRNEHVNFGVEMWLAALPQQQSQEPNIKVDIIHSLCCTLSATLLTNAESRPDQQQTFGLLQGILSGHPCIVFHAISLNSVIIIAIKCCECSCYPSNKISR